MKKLLFLLLITAVSYGQTYQNPTFGTVTTKTSPTVTNDPYVTTTGTTGIQGKIAPVNLIIPHTPVNYTVPNLTIGAHLSGIDTRLGQISSTTAGLTQRIYFTADDTTVNSVVYFASNSTGKGATAAGSPPALVLADNTKGYFTKDLISIPQPAATIGYAGSYSGNLTVSATPTPVATQQRFTVEVYRTNNLGTPIASGVSGAPVGDLGVTVVAILDSGIINLTAGSITNVSITGILTQNITINTGERLRYHVSAAKIGVGGGNVTFGVYYGSSYNSYYDVPVAITTDAVVNKSTVVGVTDTDALNALNTGKANDADVVHKTGNLAESINGVKTLAPAVSASGGVARGTILTPSLTVTANNDALVGLDINPTFTNGAFTGVTNYPLRIRDLSTDKFNFYVNRITPTTTVINSPIGSIDMGWQFGSSTENTVRIAIIRASGSTDGASMGFSISPTGGTTTEIMRLSKISSGVIIQNGGTFTDAGYRLDVQGTTRLNGTTTLGVLPTTSAGTYDVLTRNTASGFIEKVPSNTFAPSSSVHNPVTIGTANGLSLSTQVLSLGLSSGSTNGALSSTDWNAFNGKQNALGYTAANDSNVVHKTGFETILGTKRFEAVETTIGVSFLEQAENTYLSATGYTSIAFDANSMNIMTGAGKNFNINHASVTSGKTFSLPNATGTFALTSDLSVYATTASPAFTGTPTAPTAAPGTNTAQVATMAALQAAASTGFYTPTVISSVNCTSPGFLVCRYTKVGNIVTCRLSFVSGNFTTANTFTSVNFALPIPKTSTLPFLNIGSATVYFSSGEYEPVVIQTVSGSSTDAVLSFKTPTTNTGNVIGTFMYDVTE